jgi:hypothetical protein
MLCSDSGRFRFGPDFHLQLRDLLGIVDELIQPDGSFAGVVGRIEKTPHFFIVIIRVHFQSEVF